MYHLFNVPPSNDDDKPKAVKSKKPGKFSSIKTTNNRPVYSEYIEYIDNFLVKKKYNPIQRAAILGQIIEESGGYPYAIYGDSEGIAQWSDERYNIKYKNDLYKELDNQLNYLDSTMRNHKGGDDWTHGGEGSGYDSYRQLYNMFWASPSIDSVTKGISFGYVRPKKKHEEYNNRLKVSKQVLDILTQPTDPYKPR